jgi:hypothetical protein
MSVTMVTAGDTKTNSMTSYYGIEHEQSAHSREMHGWPLHDQRGDSAFLLPGHPCWKGVLDLQKFMSMSLHVGRMQGAAL